MGIIIDKEWIKGKIQERKDKEVKQITNNDLLIVIDNVIKKGQNPQLCQIYNNICRNVDFSVTISGSYRGQKENDIFCQGYGEFINDYQTLYKLGEWNKDQLEGYGCSIYVNQAEKYHEYYIGQFQKGKAHGDGKITKSDGSYYSGSFQQGVPTGNGKIFITNFSLYTGQVKDGKMNGQGELTLFEDQDPKSLKNIVLIGEFQDDQMIKGKIIYPDYGIYNGEMKDGKMHGKGEMVWNDGSYYYGQFFENQRHGQGVSKIREKEAEWWIWENDQKKQQVQPN